MENSHCFNCKNYDESRQGNHYCSAFPSGEGIPQSILKDEVMHTSKVPNQVGDFVYEPMEEEKQRRAG